MYSVLAPEDFCSSMTRYLWSLPVGIMRTRASSDVIVASNRAEMEIVFKRLMLTALVKQQMPAWSRTWRVHGTCSLNSSQSRA